MFFVFLFYHVHNMLSFFLGKRKINFKHLIAKLNLCGGKLSGSELVMGRKRQLPQSVNFKVR